MQFLKKFKGERENLYDQKAIKVLLNSTLREI